MLSTVIAIILVSCQAAPLPTIVRLQRQTLTQAETGRSKNFYSTTVTLGQPAQEFHVAFDLGGGTTVLPSTRCRSAACLERRRYDKWASDTAVDIQADGRQVQPGSPKVKDHTRRDKGTLEFLSADIGSGTVVGNFVRDRLCIGADGKELKDEGRCFPLALLLAYEMADLPFGAEPYDGTIGLSLEGMSVSHDFNFLNAFMKGNTGLLPNSFALDLGSDEDGGQITFGSYDVKQLRNPLEWVTVAEPEDGRWQVAISAIRVGNNTLNACRGGECRAALDYGASLLSVPPQLVGSMEQALENLAVPSGYGDGCQITAMPDLQLVLKNDVTLTLPAEDYVRQTRKSENGGILSGPSRSCRPLLAQQDFDDSSVGKATFVLGESILRRYLTFFDGESLQVGFSLALGTQKGKAKALPPLLEAGKGKEWLSSVDPEEDGKDNGKKPGILGNNNGKEPVILLVQVKLRRSKTVSSVGL